MSTAVRKYHTLPVAEQRAIVADLFGFEADPSPCCPRCGAVAVAIDDFGHEVLDPSHVCEVKP